MAKETLRSMLNGQKIPKLVINTEVLLALGATDGIVYAKLVELSANQKIKRVNGNICCSRQYISKYIPFSLSTVDRAIANLKAYKLIQTKLSDNGENIYWFNYSKAKKVFIDKTENLSSKSTNLDDSWGYDNQLDDENKKQNSREKSNNINIVTKDDYLSWDKDYSKDCDEDYDEDFE